MTKKELKKYFDILEISPEATLMEIRSAYSRLKKLYSTDSVVISPIEDEFSIEERQKILEQIEDAYTKLMEQVKESQDRLVHHERPFAAGHNTMEGEEASISYSGQVLRQIREKMGIELFEVSLDTKIRVELLENIEQERFDDLPPEVYLKGHIINYANYLLLDSQKAAADYIARYRAWEKANKEEK
ncbi:MAG: helix-turn-helix domain-containing protein [Candidatus Aminicenantes bacterium]|nr:helix-turn-helix domain-containing protein [Candidatus Aminicenantes bacterium]MDH5466140.1 helix-turn-helix domain-containing protein [Candidatus Aminicenantes bacterium]MDH5704485.1 helix-turn-helix domain-containing protein [Candidatus Aminicenantes bacterium]